LSLSVVGLLLVSEVGGEREYKLIEATKERAGLFERESKEPDQEKERRRKKARVFLRERERERERESVCVCV
jgi:hypothetical protein